MSGKWTAPRRSSNTRWSGDRWHRRRRGRAAALATFAKPLVRRVAPGIRSARRRRRVSTRKTCGIRARWPPPRGLEPGSNRRRRRVGGSQRPGPRRHKKTTRSGSETSPPAPCSSPGRTWAASPRASRRLRGGVLAHVGAPVSASRLTLSPADAVHTRLGGASDRVDAGEHSWRRRGGEHLARRLARPCPWSWTSSGEERPRSTPRRRARALHALGARDRMSIDVRHAFPRVDSRVSPRRRWQLRTWRSGEVGVPRHRWTAPSPSCTS